VCQAGTVDTQCGKSGVACVNCDPSGTQRKCVSQICKCDKTLCKNESVWNCCDTSTQQCVDGCDPDHCGSDGDPCESCGSWDCCDWSWQTCESYCSTECW
jgi:hypothetical protein